MATKKTRKAAPKRKKEALKVKDLAPKDVKAVRGGLALSQDGKHKGEIDVL